jgi:putative transposase
VTYEAASVNQASRANGLGQQDALISPHPLYLALGQTAKQRQSAYRALFRAQLDADPIDDIRLALNQNQPLGNARFYAKIEKVTGQRREPKPRGRPRLSVDAMADERQRQLL